MRIVALRLLVAWWMIPTLWLVGWPLAFLIFGAHEANELCSELTETAWNGA